MQPNFQPTDFQAIENREVPRSKFVVKTDAFSYCSFRRNKRNWLSDDSFQRSGAGETEYSPIIVKQDTAAVVNAEITTEKRPRSLIFRYFCMSETKIGKWT